jgi:hypothetical protein
MTPHLSRSPPATHTASMLVLALAILAAPARADQAVPAAAVPGATFEEVLAIARRLSPELAARALDTEAAQARVAVAGSLADPMIRITADEIDRTSGPRLGRCTTRSSRNSRCGASAISNAPRLAPTSRAPRPMPA